MASPSVAQAALRRARVGSSSAVAVGRLASSDSIETGGFTPGSVLADRYRIIGLIGRGGMGEVYRADDLKLGQPVALKFLPERFSTDELLLDKLFSEVRIARQVSHPNVCRVYDVGEADGRHFLSMEYVDGEDLASLLRRIGGLPHGKALEIARQLCAGLAAAHERGVLHRDLKPANVMVDGRGRARIMDFGLAVPAGEGAAGAELAGTPAYMAPEQFAGKGASVRSDLYALGLVLFELYTGRRAFDAGTAAGYRQKHMEEIPSSPSSITDGIDPAVERAILRCIEKDPQMRPASAAQVAAALPGGDPLAAAVAAGETPSPEMVAAAGAEDRLSPAVAKGLLALTVAAVLILAFTARRVCLLPVAGSEKSGEVLRVRAREILSELGMRDRPADWAGAFRVEENFLGWVAERDPSSGRWRHGIARDALSYMYREAPIPLVPVAAVPGPFPGPVVTDSDPAPLRSGMKEVVLDPEGRLKELQVVPPPVENSSASALPPAPDWTPLFRAAGLDMSLFHTSQPRWSPRAYADARLAWEGPHPERPGLTMRVEAAASRGRPVSFLWIGPWTRSSREAADSVSAGGRAANIIWSAVLMTLLFGGVWLARRNLRSGRGDRRGAARIAVAIAIAQLCMWVLGAHHVATVDETDILANGLADMALMSGFFWALYVALEPFMRRHWPRMLISWTRLLAGGWRDPLVGRDLLVGASAGALIGMLMGPVRRVIPVLLGEPPPVPRGFPGGLFSSVPSSLATLMQIPGTSLVWVLGIVMFLVLVRRVVRYEWIAALLVAILFSSNYLGTPPLYVTLPVVTFATGLLVVVAIRFGLLAALVCQICNVSLSVVMTPEPSAWYFYPGAIGIALVLALAFWGLRTSAPSTAATG